MKTEVIKFRPMVDWSTWSMILLVLACCALPALLGADWLTAVILCVCAAVCLLPFFSIRYEVDGDDLVVYALWRPSRFPISKIKEVAMTRSVISAPATSFAKRLAITFTDRSVLKSSAPMMISPADQKKFIDTLKARNPSIIIK